MMDCNETFLGCITAAQWQASLAWAFIGGMFIYLYMLYDGIRKSATTKPTIDPWHWIKNPKNWLRIIINTLAMVIIIRLGGPLGIPEALGLGIGIEAAAEAIVHKFHNPLN